VPFISLAVVLVIVPLPAVRIESISVAIVPLSMSFRLVLKTNSQRDGRKTHRTKWI
jgi:hypothetical protein